MNENIQNCLPKNDLVKIEREHWYSITQTETFLSTCQDSGAVIYEYKVGNVSEHIFIISCLLFGVILVSVLSLDEIIKWYKNWK